MEKPAEAYYSHLVDLFIFTIRRLLFNLAEEMRLALKRVNHCPVIIIIFIFPSCLLHAGNLGDCLSAWIGKLLPPDLLCDVLGCL